jgi:hypothetical protein
MRNIIHFMAAVVSLLVASSAHAAVFLNGVNIDGVINQTFENCTVKIDEKGNVLITAKGFEVQATGAASPPSQPTPPPTLERVTKQYFLVSDMSTPGHAQFDVDVFINQVWVKRVNAADGQVIVDISKHLHKGKNTIHFTATKNVKEGRKSVSPADYLKLHVGEGSVSGNNVMLDNPLIEYTRTAAEMGTFDDDLVITGR